MNAELADLDSTTQQMPGDPLVSVVMSVYNAGGRLAETLDSLLDQQGCSFEIVVINDGSTDHTLEILNDYVRRDCRVRVFSQTNSGLTRALILGCEKARGRYIARQDADDASLPGRLQVQSEYLASHPEAVLVASTVRFVAPEGEWLHDSVPSARVVIELDVDRIRTPPLVGSMFCRDAYLRCGGFHKEFVVAQDVDLWLRLDETGACHGIEHTHYQARMTLGGISSRRREAQYQMGKLAIDCAKLRRSGGDETSLLSRSSLPLGPKRPMTGRERARFNYFIACCLRSHDPQAARRYFRRALRDNPLHLKAMAHWLTGT